MRGKFYEILDALFFERDYDEGPMRANVSRDDRVDWFMAYKAGRLSFRTSDCWWFDCVECVGLIQRRTRNKRLVRANARRLPF